jgi:glycosyltransferase involved in cell wall biosynthesis
MLVSIIIPIYNVESYVERCLLSVLNQTYDDIEIILVDDCGQDKSMEIANQVIQNHRNRYRTAVLKHLHNRGLSAARNTGIKAATGDYLYFLDSDDELPLIAIETLAFLAMKYNPDFVIGNISTTNTNRDYSLQMKNIEFIEGNTKILNLFSQGKWHEMAWNKLINKEFVLNNNLYFYEGLYHEDALWSFQLATKTKSMAVAYLPTYIYHVRKNSISQNLQQKNIDDLIFILNQIKYIIQSDKKFIKNIYILTYYENLIFHVLICTSNTLFWTSTYSKLKNLFLINPKLFFKTPVKTIIKIIVICFLPQNILRKFVQKFNSLK